MKKITVLLVSMLMGLTATAAVKTTDGNGKELRISNGLYHFTQPIMFVERGVEFLVFPNGEFDFNTELVSAPYQDNFYYRKSRTKRGVVNVTFGAPGTRYNYNRPHGVMILHDRFGRVRRIGNVFLNYDYKGRIKRIGSVYMTYRHGRLKRVGGLTIRYNRHGDIVGTYGKVNRFNHGYNYFTPSHSWDNDWNDNDWNEDYSEDYFYYRKGNKVEKRLKTKQKRKK